MFCPSQHNNVYQWALSRRSVVGASSQKLKYHHICTYIRYVPTVQDLVCSPYRCDRNSTCGGYHTV